MAPTDEVYLGDGLYASFDGWQIKLRAPQGARGDQEVFLEPEVYDAFVQFADRCFRRKPVEQPKPVSPDEEIAF